MRGPAILLLALAVAAGGCARQAASTTGRRLTPVILQTDWYAQAEHGGFYQALVKGYYRDAGLDVRIASSGPQVPIGQKLATGVVQFMIGRSDDCISWISRDIPVIIVSAQMQHDVQALLLHAEDPANTFRDLDGRRVMTVPGANWVQYVEKAYHIHIPVMNLNLGMAQFMADPRFIQQCFLTNEPYYVEMNGEHAKTLLFSDAGYDNYRVLIGNADWVASHPKETQAFVQASIRGWHDYLYGDPSEANRMILECNPQMKPEYIAYAIAAMKRYNLVYGFAAKGESIGVLSRPRLQQQIDIMASIGRLDRPVTVDEVADFRFQVPAASHL
jgi:NitT/TauT family transport system substrate-binding protein